MHTIRKSIVTEGADGTAVLLDPFSFKIFRRLSLSPHVSRLDELMAGPSTMSSNGDVII
jgi:hypothetical protein